MIIYFYWHLLLFGWLLGNDRTNHRFELSKYALCRNFRKSIKNIMLKNCKNTFLIWFFEHSIFVYYLLFLWEIVSTMLTLVLANANKSIALRTLPLPSWLLLLVLWWLNVLLLLLFSLLPFYWFNYFLLLLLLLFLLFRWLGYLFRLLRFTDLTSFTLIWIHHLLEWGQINNIYKSIFELK